MSLFWGKYRIESTRLKGFDYTSPGSYFVTINTHNMIYWFGDVVGGKMRLSDVGEIVNDEWLATPGIRPTVTLDQYQIMPNHFHGIIMIHENESTARSGHIPFVNWEKAMVVPGVNPVETTCRVVSTDKPTLKPNSLGSILGQFKSTCTKRIHDVGYRDFQWQSLYWDHIIRGRDDLERIRKYIIDNPRNWHKDA